MKALASSESRRLGHPKSAQDFADLISRNLDQAVTAVIRAGEWLVNAKAALPRGEWLQMFHDHETPIERPLAFGARTAQMLMKVAEHPVLSNANHGSCLPTSWRTLYELAKLPEPLLQKALDDGHVHPGMDRKHVMALRVDLTPRTPMVVDGGPAPREFDQRANPEMDLSDFDRDLTAAFPDLTREEQIRVVARLRQIADTLEVRISAAPVVTVVPVVNELKAEYVCMSCLREMSKDDTIEVRECPQCEERFDGDECGRNCPSCNRPFSRLLAEAGCPDCHEECEELVEDETEPAVATG